MTLPSAVKAEVALLPPLEQQPHHEKFWLRQVATARRHCNLPEPFNEVELVRTVFLQMDNPF